MSILECITTRVLPDCDLTGCPALTVRALGVDYVIVPNAAAAAAAAARSRVIALVMEQNHFYVASAVPNSPILLLDSLRPAGETSTHSLKTNDPLGAYVMSRAGANDQGWGGRLQTRAQYVSCPSQRSATHTDGTNDSNNCYFHAVANVVSEILAHLCPNGPDQAQWDAGDIGNLHQLCTLFRSNDRHARIFAAGIFDQAPRAVIRGGRLRVDDTSWHLANAEQGNARRNGAARRTRPSDVVFGGRNAQLFSECMHAIPYDGHWPSLATARSNDGELQQNCHRRPRRRRRQQQPPPPPQHQHQDDDDDDDDDDEVPQPPRHPQPPVRDALSSATSNFMEPSGRDSAGELLRLYHSRGPFVRCSVPGCPQPALAAGGGEARCSICTLRHSAQQQVAAALLGPSAPPKVSREAQREANTLQRNIVASGMQYALQQEALDVCSTCECCVGHNAEAEADRLWCRARELTQEVFEQAEVARKKRAARKKRRLLRRLLHKLRKRRQAKKKCRKP